MTRPRRGALDKDSKEKPESPGQGGSFADAVSSIGDVKPLDRSNVSQHAPSEGRQTRSVARTKARSEAEKGLRTAKRPTPVATQEPGSEISVRATRTELRRLRAGKIRPQRTVDLHGYSQDQAYRRLCNVIGKAAEEGLRCVLVVHGKGRNSPEGRSVLKHALGDWIAVPPLANRVIGCCRAQPADGGDGASYLLLRK